MKKIKIPKQNLKILFRTSGGRAPGKQLGMGHIYRTLNLAKSFDTDKIIFLIDDYPIAGSVIKKTGFPLIHYIKKKHNLEYEINKLKNIIQQYNIDLVIFDKYHVSISIIKKIKRLCKVVVISDLNKIDYPADLVVNGFVGYNNAISKNKFASKTLLGPKFQILNPNFERKKNSKKEYDLLVTFGGFDESRIIEKFCEFFYNCESKVRTKIILGPATDKSKILKKFEDKLSDYVVFQPSTNKMYKEMESCKYGLCSGGLTTYEFSRMGIFFGIINQVRHQMNTANIWEKKKCAINLGMGKNLSSSQLCTFLKNIQYENYPLNTAYLKNNGINEIKKHIMQLFPNNH